MPVSYPAGLNRSTRENNSKLSKTVVCTYHADGVARSVKFNNVCYYYLYNLQGDVTTIYDQGGNHVVEYTYDAWGKQSAVTGSMASTLGALNPLRYRGYIYDNETGLYYCHSRYYDPETCRWINADSYITTGQGITSYNMFAYCSDNPINFVDKFGYFAATAIGAIETIILSYETLMQAFILMAAVLSAVAVLPTFIDTISKANIDIKVKDETDVATRDITLTKQKNNDNDVYFPTNPSNFNPKGLRVEKYVTDNGLIIKWSEPNLKKAIFEWDEDKKGISSHYHIIAYNNGHETHGGTHYYPGTKIPEPYKTKYF